MHTFLGLLFSLALVLPAAAQPAQPATPPVAADQQPTPDNILRELNIARTNPGAYADHLEKNWKPYYKGKMRNLPGAEMVIETNEGLKAVDEAIRYLRKAKPIAPLTLETGMSKAAADHVADMARKNHTEHQGSDGSEPDTRVSRYGTWGVTISENLMFGPSKARDIVLDLIVDDGVPDRGHRTNIFDPQAKVVGIAFGKHPDYGWATVMDFAGSFVAKNR